MSELLEILSPVGDMERLYAALDFGADAVYLGGSCFGMRAASANFDTIAASLHAVSGGVSNKM